MKHMTNSWKNQGISQWQKASKEEFYSRIYSNGYLIDNY